MDDSLVDSIYDVEGESSDNYAPMSKAKAPVKKKAAGTASIKSATAKAVDKKPNKTALKSKAVTKKRAKPDSDEENVDDEDSVEDDDSLLSNTPPSAKRKKKATALPKSLGKPLQPMDNESHNLDGTKTSKTKGGKATSASDEYQQLTPIEHILKRPDTYIGSVERTEKEMWVFNSETEAMERREVSFVPGLYKIFDEIIVNAADNKQRDKENMDEIRVTVDREKGEISIKNNGRGLPIEIHKSNGLYIPEMIFGHLLTSSNYDDNREKVTGGRNGYGAKLCNVFSTRFELQTVDSRVCKKYVQTWTNNMSTVQPAKITACKTADYTMVTFCPDFSKFGMGGMDNDFEALVKRRVYDMAGTCKDVKVYLNGERVKIRNFKQYMAMYTKAVQKETAQKAEEGAVAAVAADSQVILMDNPNASWEIGFAVSDGSFQHVSFVNSIPTTSGGTHVNYIADQVVERLTEVVKKKNKGGVVLKSNQIRNHIFLFINCLIVNPAFTSQTKEQLTTKPSQFGSKCSVSEKFLKDIAKTEAVTNIMHFAQKKADLALKKSDGHKRTRMDNAKLTDANKAGSKDGYKCTLILTEGDSASLLALAGRAVVDPDLIGVFPLRGKLLNVRDASVDQITKNQEIQNIKKFMGLQHKRHYEDTRSLRYGHLMIMTDQDHDGSHIKGLLINFLEVSFPSLLKIPGFLKEFITPIVKVWKGDPKHPKKLKSFFTMPEYEAWKETIGTDRTWDHKYFKGLGTSSPNEDAETYFRDPDRHIKEFKAMEPHEPELLELAFSKKKADARKEWLRQFRPGTFLDMTIDKISYEDFVNKELILFSMADNQRSIPSVIDGFKPGQRKVLYTCFRRNLKKDIKVVELAGSVSGLTAYAYGDTSLQQTIVGLAQNFVGSNNINCLEPSGNFGSRLQGGSDAASARYIYTRLSPFARKIFNAADEPLLTYNMDDGKTIEPEMYVPVVPMILINGADGIGTGWSSTIPNYSPEDVVENLLLRMDGASKEVMKPMKPWFRGWKGEIEDSGNDRFKFTGVFRSDGSEVEITELPIRTWTQDFKERLEEMMKSDKVPSLIKDYLEYNTPSKVHFIINMDEKQVKVGWESKLEDIFKLSKSVATTNLVAFDGQGRIHKYATVLDIMEEFYHIRLQFYEQRKSFLLRQMENELDKYNNQSKFIRMIIDGKLVVSKKSKKALIAELKQKGFTPIPKVADARKETESEPTVDPEEDTENVDKETEAGAHDYDYLLGMPIWSLTQDRVDRLAKQISDKEMEHGKLQATSSKDLWRKDLQEFIDEWRFQLQDEAKRAREIALMGRRTSAKLRIKGTAGGKRKRLLGDDDDSDFAVSKSKKSATAAAKAKPISMYEHLSKLAESQKAVKSRANGIEQKPVSKPPAVIEGLLPDSTADFAIHEQPLKTSASDDEDFMDIDQVIVPAGAVNRQSRVAARKPVKYALSDNSEASDDNGDDLLGDVTSMVKGIPKGQSKDDAPPSGKTSLFSTSASRPSSSHGLGTKPAAKLLKKSASMSDDDETDYGKLVPKDSPLKVAARSARDVILPGDEDNSLDFATSRPALKQPARPTISAAAAAYANKLKKASATSSKSKAPLKGAANTYDADEPRLKPLSPAAKAYAAKQAKATKPGSLPLHKPLAKTAKKPKKKDSSDEESEVDDDQDLVNDLLSDDNHDNEGQHRAGSAAAARPSRRVAATKSKYVVESESDDFEEEAETSYQSESD